MQDQRKCLPIEWKIELCVLCTTHICVGANTRDSI